MNETRNPPMKLTYRENLFYNMIDNFFSHCDINDVQKVVDIICGKSKISLRILDWFSTRYSNKNKILITSNDALTDVHISYKAQLRSYKKKYFDPFKRSSKKKNNSEYRCPKFSYNFHILN